MKSIAALLFLLSASAAASSPSVWLEPVPRAAGSSQEWLPINNFFEVPASRLSTAETWLSGVPYLRQVQHDMGFWGHPNYECPGSTRGYLVRALYENGGTGEYALWWTPKEELVVAHSALGPAGSVLRSALVACLPKEPVAVYSAISGAT